VSGPASTTSLGDARGLPAHLRPAGSGVARWTLTLVAVLFLSAFIVWPTVNVFRGAFANGVSGYVRTFYAPPPDPATLAGLPRRERLALQNEVRQAPKTREAIRMTVLVAAVVVPLNVVFGLAAAWLVAKFEFKGKTFLVSVIDLPFSVSPVVAGLVFVLLMGSQGVLGDWATRLNWPWPGSAYWRGFDAGWFPVGFADWRQGVIFTPLATVLASAFVTFPFVARALIPLMESQGNEAEQAAITLGAGGAQTFRRVTLPAIKWGLLYGVILCTARSIGEFGAVSVVSGGTDANDTLPLRVSKVWESFNQQQAFAMASLLAGVSLVTLLFKVVIDRRQTAAKKGGHE
jgi:sulfate/thiosulfate transport system permease protein